MARESRSGDPTSIQRESAFSPVIFFCAIKSFNTKFHISNGALGKLPSLKTIGFIIDIPANVSLFEDGEIKT